MGMWGSSRQLVFASTISAIAMVAAADPPARGDGEDGGGVAGCAAPNFCDCPDTVSDGVLSVEIGDDNTTDGSPVPECGGQIQFDKWWNYTASCTGTLTIESTDWGSVAHAVAIYDGWDCPPADENVLGCSVSTSDPIFIAVPVTQGRQIKFRIGSWGGDTGSTAELSITCGPTQCGDPGTGECCEIGGNGGASCNNVTCCEAVTAILPHCALQWDGVCAAQATVTCALCGGPPLAQDCNDNGIADGTELGSAPYIGQLTANNSTAQANYGYALAANGSGLIVGAFGENAEKGGAYFYREIAGGKGAYKYDVRRAPGSEGSRFGISADIRGSQAIVGADRDSDAGHNAGAVHLFFDAAPVGGTWQHSFKLTADDAAPGDHFGTAVAIFGDRCVIGSPYAAAGGSGRGKAYVYRTNFPLLVSTLLPSDGADGDSFGWSAAMRSNGYAVIGAPFGDSDEVSDSGAAYVFSSGGGWHEVAKLVADDPQQFAAFGESVAIDGDIIVIGAPTESSAAFDAGAAYVFRESSPGEWTQVAKLTAHDASESALFGRSVAVSGGMIVVGAPGHDGHGAAYAFLEQPVGSGQWEQATPMQSHMGAANEQFGISVAATGDVILVGEWLDTQGGEVALGSASIRRKPALDCNDNAIPDDCDTDSNGNGLPDDCEDKDPCAAFDLNCDESVGVADLLLLLGEWGQCDNVEDCPADLDGDGSVGVSDLLILLANWG